MHTYMDDASIEMATLTCPSPCSQHRAGPRQRHWGPICPACAPPRHATLYTGGQGTPQGPSWRLLGAWQHLHPQLCIIIKPAMEQSTPPMQMYTTFQSHVSGSKKRLIDPT
mmetsp:Transcript_2701/g.3380  ORF Transcript_2701/g.3380 Transcript_2701/m.3380 type:complete len:111 (-) Transcript_2701:218-550(-)